MQGHFLSPFRDHLPFALKETEKTFKNRFLRNICLLTDILFLKNESEAFFGCFEAKQQKKVSLRLYFNQTSPQMDDVILFIINKKFLKIFNVADSVKN